MDGENRLLVIDEAISFSNYRLKIKSLGNQPKYRNNLFEVEIQGISINNWLVIKK